MSTATETRDQILQRIRERNAELKRLDRQMAELRQANMRDEFALDDLESA